jgi:hypothetical protein
LLKKSQSAQFADAFNKISLPRQTKPRLMNSSFRLELEVSYGVGLTDTSRPRRALDNFVAGRAARPAASPSPLGSADE